MTLPRPAPTPLRASLAELNLEKEVCGLQLHLGMFEVWSTHVGAF